MDAAGVTVGRLLSATEYVLTVLTSTGYMLGIGWDASFYPSQVYYTGGACTGNAYLNDGGSSGLLLPGKVVYWVGSKNSFMVPANVSGTTGMATSVPISATGLDNPTCNVYNSSSSGWLLTTITRASAGIPASFSLPLKVQ